MMQAIMLTIRKFITKLPVMTYDICAIPVAWYSAYWLRFNLHPEPGILTSNHSIISLGFLVIVQSVCYYYFKTYRGLWRFSSLDDVIRILKASITAVVLVIPVLIMRQNSLS